MDSYCEQLVKIKKGAKFYFGIIGLFLALLLVSLFALAYLRMISAIVIVAAGYGAYYVFGFLSVEYEYIITNGTLDIDIIYSKRNRKRLMSFELSEVESIDKYAGEVIDKNRYKKSIIACNKNDENAYKLTFSGDSGVGIAVISPNEKTKSEIVKSVPKFIGNNAFKQ